MYRIQLALQRMPVLQEEGEEGDVPIESWHWLLHCDRNGNLLRQFWFPQTQRFVRCQAYAEGEPSSASDVPGATEPAFFHVVNSDPSS